MRVIWELLEELWRWKRLVLGLLPAGQWGAVVRTVLPECVGLGGVVPLVKALGMVVGGNMSLCENSCSHAVLIPLPRSSVDQMMVQYVQGVCVRDMAGMRF